MELSVCVLAIQGDRLLELLEGKVGALELGVDESQGIAVEGGRRVQTGRFPQGHHGLTCLAILDVPDPTLERRAGLQSLDFRALTGRRAGREPQHGGERKDGETPHR
jgi:hypothetical protein